MFWAFAASILILILTITISNRGVVRVIGGVVLAALLVAGLVHRLRSTGEPEGERGKPASPAATINAIPIESLTLTELSLSGGGAPFELRGTVQNSSADSRLRSLTLRIVRRDCFEDALDPSGCAVIWQDQHRLQVDVPPQSERKFSTSFYARVVPRNRGTLKDEFELIAASGQPATP